MKFSTQFIERVSEANNIVDIISSHTQLKPTGSGMMGRCPFPDHQEKTPSFSVSESKQVYHCFGCGKSGNIFSFLRDYQGMSFPESVEFLANRAGIAMPLPEKNVDVENAEQQRKKLILKVNKYAQNFFAETLQATSEDHPARSYLKKRNLSAETIATFQIGLAPPLWEGLVEYLKSHNIPLTLAEEAQLVKPKSSGGYYDLFKDRIMFPIIGPLGDMLAFGGRILDQGQPKYLNSPETSVFIKGKVLYGLPQTAKFIRTEDTAIVVEGYMDLISLFQAGIKNVVAIMGTALTADHAKMLKRMTRNVLVLLDGDQAGQTAAERSLPILLAGGLYPKGFSLPEGQDPDDFIRLHGPEELTKQLSNAPDLASLVMKSWLKGYRGEASDKVKFSDRLGQLLQHLTDLRLKDLYISEAAQKLGTDVSWLRKAIANPVKNFNPSTAPAETPVSRPASNIAELEQLQYLIKTAPSIEKNAISLALKTRANFEAFLEENGMQVISHEGIAKLFNFAKDVYGQDRKQFDRLLSQLVSIVDEPQSLFYRDASTAYNERKELRVESSSETFLDEAQANEVKTELKLMKDIVKRMKETTLKIQLKKLALDLKMDPSPDKYEELKRIQKEISSLTSSLNSASQLNEIADKRS